MQQKFGTALIWQDNTSKKDMSRTS